jgi:hypothetical protein
MLQGAGGWGQFMTEATPWSLRQFTTDAGWISPLTPVLCTISDSEELQCTVDSASQSIWRMGVANLGQWVALGCSLHPAWSPLDVAAISTDDDDGDGDGSNGCSGGAIIAPTNRTGTPSTPRCSSPLAAPILLATLPCPAHALPPKDLTSPVSVIDLETIHTVRVGKYNAANG